MINQMGIFIIIDRNLGEKNHCKDFVWNYDGGAWTLGNGRNGFKKLLRLCDLSIGRIDLATIQEDVKASSLLISCVDCNESCLTGVNVNNRIVNCKAHVIFKLVNLAILKCYDMKWFPLQGG